MDNNRKRELREAYKNRHPEMGVIAARCVPAGALFLAPVQDIPARLNRLRFQLSAGNCGNRKLQALWNRYGQEAVALEVLKRLEYEDPAEDHTEELEMLCELCLLENPGAERL
ncbi:MAG: GIY-YIG nuclease family protein [Oscillibacter sp.]|nr:GIY-YIG nuclease family protein [Oscillibacter sp.]